MNRATAALMLAALVTAACGSSSDGPAADPGAGDPAAVDLRECHAPDDPVVYTPPPEEQPAVPTGPGTTVEHRDDIAIRNEDDRPVRTDAEYHDDVDIAGPDTSLEVFEALRGWAERDAPEHFGGLWTDHDHGAHVVAFTEEVDRYAQEVRDRFGAGWWVVEADHTEAELERLQDAAFEASIRGETDDPETPPGFISVTGRSVQHGQVRVGIVGGDDDAVASVVAQLDHPAYCFEVSPPPPEPDDDGPVRTLATIEGWRAELEDETDLDARLEIAFDRETAERAFAENVPDRLPAGGEHPATDGLHAGLDTVDWDREVVAVYTGGRSGSCPVWIDELMVAGDHLEVSTRSPVQGACTADYQPFRTVLAVDRDRLPPAADLPMPIGDGHLDSEQAVVYPGG